MRNKFLYPLLGSILISTAVQAQTTVKGKVVDIGNKSISNVTVKIGDKSILTSSNGEFEIFIDREGNFLIEFSSVDYSNSEIFVKPKGLITKLNPVVLKRIAYSLDEVEVFGERYKRPKGLDAITRMPLIPSDQIQTISIISNIVIQAQGV